MSTPPALFLPRLTEEARRRASLAKAQEEALTRLARAVGGGPPRFRRALVAGAPMAIIAESKRCSPSKGDLTGGVPYAPGERARLYEGAGADAMSVLTEPEFFGGNLVHLAEARAHCRLPLLRKDFLLEPAQVAEAVLSGADAILLIVRILTDKELRTMLTAARALQVDALVEVHTADELGRALEAGADLIGVNNRDLDTFDTRLERSLELAPQIPEGVVAVSESGIRTTEDVERLREAGFGAVLVGEQLMTWGIRLVEEVTAWRSR